MKTHLDVVGLIDVVTGAFSTALAMLVPVAALVLAPEFNGASPWRPGERVMVIGAVLLVSGLFYAIGIPSLIAGVGLLKHRDWARILAIVVAVLALASFPIGTAVGLYALWVLTHQETVQLPDTANWTERA